MKYAAGGVTVRAGEPATVEVAVAAPAAKTDTGGKRLRVSGWMDHPATAYGRWIDVKTGKFQEDHSMIEAARGALDDITFLSGIWMSKTRGVTWRVDSVPGFLQKAIDVCHQNDVQIFLGYSIADEGGMIGGRSKLFREWIHDPASTGLTPAQHAQDICDFVFDTNGFDVDGIAFDLELNGLKAEDADNFGLFYGALADLLAGKGKVLSVATGVGNVNNEASWLGLFRAQPFRLAKGHPNFIIRPMAYDNFALDDAAFLQWHKDIVDYALNKVGLDPGQLQLGLKISKNVHSQDQSWLPPPGWSERKCTFDTAGIADRCTNLLRPNGAGLVTFAGWGDFAAFNAALNPGCDPAGTQGTPVQAPRGGAAAEASSPQTQPQPEPEPAAAQAQPADQPPPDPPAQAQEQPADNAPILRWDDPRLSDKRKRLFVEVNKRIPSVEGTPPEPGKVNLFDGVAHMTHGTSCGLLPGVVMQRLGIHGPISQYATEGVRIEAQKMGIWVESDGTARPLPGDIYVLRYPERPDEDSVQHVGIFYELDKQDPQLGLIWVTADAGQGSHEVQEAKLVNRAMEKVDGVHPFLSGPKNTPGDSPQLRRIGGWVDVDRLIP